MNLQPNVTELRLSREFEFSAGDYVLVGPGGMTKYLFTGLSQLFIIFKKTLLGYYRVNRGGWRETGQSYDGLD